MDIKDPRTDSRLRYKSGRSASHTNDITIGDHKNVEPHMEELVQKLRSMLMLDNFEVYVSMLKFTIGTGIFSKPFLYYTYGFSNCIIGDIVDIFIVALSNQNLIRAMELMPKELTTPESKLTYGKVVGYVLDERDCRLTGAKAQEYGIFCKILDFCVLFSNTISILGYLWWVNA